MTKKTNEKKVTEKKANKTKKTVKEEKTKKSIFQKIVGYFKGVKKETKRIRWTKPKELVKYSITTIIFIVFFSAFFYVIDLLVALLRSSL